MTIIRKVTTPSRVALAVAALTILPSLTTSVIAEAKNKELRTDQSAGYLGKVSRRAIDSGMLDRLQSNASHKDLDRDSGLAAADLRTRIEFWHLVALDTVALDHTTSRNGEGETAPVQNGGPTRTSRALAMIQIATFEAANADDEDYESFLRDVPNVNNSVSVDAAVAQAAYDTLVSLYPDQEPRLTELYEQDLALINASEDDDRVEDGIEVGATISDLIIDNRDGDKSETSEPDFGAGGEVANGTTNYFGTPVNGGTTNVAEWEPDPNTPDFAGDYNLSLGAYWGSVEPFFLDSGDQYRSAEPPLPGDAAYAAAYNEVKQLGGSPENLQTPSTSTDETRFIGNFWGYDGVPLIGVPPRVYNQIAAQIGSTQIQDPVDYARFLAMINVAMADTAIAAWDSKYYYNYWRPVTGIRKDDGTDATLPDETWNPVGVSVINTEEAIRPTPPFPAYPSGHAAFGATVFELMREFFDDNTAFTFVSDEFNGEGVDPFFPEQPRPLVPVRFESFTDAQEQNGRSRVYNGVHWNFDDIAGQEMGVKIAQFLLNDTDAFSEDRGGKKGKGKNSKGKNRGN